MNKRIGQALATAAFTGAALTAAGTSTASATTWHYAWGDSHTPTTSWSTKNVGIGPHGSGVRFDVRCTGGGTYAVEIRKAGAGIRVTHNGGLKCDGRWYSLGRTGLSTKWAYYARISTDNGKRPLWVYTYWG